MDVYTGFIYPMMLGVSAVLAVTGLVTLAWVKAHRALTWVVTAAYVATAVQFITVLVVLLSDNSAGLVLTIGYLLATLALLPLLGIGRLGEPDAAATDPDPNRPVLAPDQIARVDGVAAAIVAIAMAVVAWRIYEILVAGA